MSGADDTNVETPARKTRRRRLKRTWRSVSNGLGFTLYLIAIVLVGMAGWAASANVIKSGWNSDAAAWVQAAGSIAAIAGATWVAQSEARRARRARRQQNEEAAWYVRFALKQAQFDSQIIAAELVNRTTPVEESDVRDWRQRAATSAIGLNALVTRTDHVHPAVTHVLSNAKVLVDDLIDNIVHLGKLLENRKQPDHDLIGQIVAPHRALIELIDTYDARMRGVALALDEGDDALPIKTWTPWDPDHTENRTK